MIETGQIYSLNSFNNSRLSSETHDKSVNNQEKLIKKLDLKELSVLRQLQSRDQEVRAHEAAHLAAAGGYANGGASFVYQKGPDGKMYAIGGEVGIDSGPDSGDPKATLQKAQTIRRAALAPANPSTQDKQVAAAASRMETMARMEMARLTREESDSTEIAATSKSTMDDESYEEDHTGNSDLSLSKVIGAYQSSNALMSEAEPPLIDLYV